MIIFNRPVGPNFAITSINSPLTINPRMRYFFHWFAYLFGVQRFFLSRCIFRHQKYSIPPQLFLPQHKGHYVVTCTNLVTHFLQDVIKQSLLLLLYFCYKVYLQLAYLIISTNENPAKFISRLLESSYWSLLI